MDKMRYQIPFTVPFVFISGSYEKGRPIDKLCDFLGSGFAQNNIGLISGGGRPAEKVGEGMHRAMDALDQYDPFKIITVYRKKFRDDRLLIKRFGCKVFVGNDIEGVRSFVLSKAKALVAIRGDLRTKEEILKAQELNIPIIPVGMSGGAALHVWNYYDKSDKYPDNPFFRQLNNKHPYIAAKAVIDMLKELISDD